MSNDLKSYKLICQETPTSHFIPYSHHITDNIISTKNADYLSVWRIGGRSHQSAAQQDVFQWTSELNNLLRGISAIANVSLWSHVVRRRVFEYPEAEFDNTFCRQLDERYKASFDNYNLMVNDLYLTVIIRPFADQTLSIFAKYEKESLAEKEARQVSSIKQLDDINLMIESSLKKYNAELLGTYSQAIKCGELLFISGQLPIDSHGTEIISDDPVEQTRQCFENIKAICEECNSSLDMAIKINVYYTDIAVADNINAVMEELFQAPYPARIRVKVLGLSKNAKVEIDGVFLCKT